MLRSLAALSIAFVAVSGSAQTGATGHWNGTYTFSVQLSSCSNKTFTTSGNASMTLLQTGTSISGRLDLENFLSFGNSCTPANAELTTAVVGSVNGSAISWTVPNGSAGDQFSGTIDANTIAAQWTDAAGATGSLTFTRTAGDGPGADLTGAWSGNYSFTDRCSNGKTQTYSGAMTLALAQSGGNAGGVMTMQGVPLYDQNCSKITTLDMALAVGGTLSGSTFNGGVFDPSGSFEFPIRATVANASMDGTVTGASATNTTGTFKLTQSSTTPPAADLGGTYEGSYTETDNESFKCLNIGSLTYSGDASLAVAQAGSAASGWLTLHDALDVSSDVFGNCIVVGVGDQVLPVYGAITGSTLTLHPPIGNGAVFTFTFGGDTVNGTLQNSLGDFAVVQVTRTASASPTVINSFAASPAAVVPGQPATLSWSTSNATSVSIDNNVGAQPASGSVTVFPTQTTVYTLTASGASGTETARVTVTVFQPGPKRRIVRP
ncbi:MAG TPA: hypothetical protein VLV78_21955 [Thermoanaerobaculia bacterium]|nr:hypothetical protein [Thermoanaerobaculia bacterium]